MEGSIPPTPSGFLRGTLSSKIKKIVDYYGCVIYFYIIMDVDVFFSSQRAGSTKGEPFGTQVVGLHPTGTQGWGRRGFHPYYRRLFLIRLS